MIQVDRINDVVEMDAELAERVARLNEREDDLNRRLRGLEHRENNLRDRERGAGVAEATFYNDCSMVWLECIEQSGDFDNLFDFLGTEFGYGDGSQRLRAAWDNPYGEDEFLSRIENDEEPEDAPAEAEGDEEPFGDVTEPEDPPAEDPDPFDVEEDPDPFDMEEDGIDDAQMARLGIDGDDAVAEWVDVETVETEEDRTIRETRRLEREIANQRAERERERDGRERAQRRIREREEREARENINPWTVPVASRASAWDAEPESWSTGNDEPPVWADSDEDEDEAW